MLALLAVLLTAPAARAQDPVDVGVVRQSDAIVVQKLLYPKAHTSELVSSIGILPFDAYTVAPAVQIEFDHHLSESFGLGAVAGIGYGLNTKTTTELINEYGVEPYAFRYLGSALVGVEWAPVYAKASLGGVKVVHFDLYLAGKVGVTVEQSIIPGGGMPVAPTLSPGLGTRIYLQRTLTLRIELRDDILFQWRKLTETLRVKQNTGFFAGLSFVVRKREK